MSTRVRHAAPAPIRRHLARPAMGRAIPAADQRSKAIQAADSVEDLNQILADTMTLRDLYKKHHWQVAGGSFYQLHRLFDKHFEEQVKLIDDIAERIQLLGGLSIAMAADVAETTRVPRPPRGREEAPVQLSRLLEAHEIVIGEIRHAAKAAADHGDDGTNDLLVSGVLRTNELQVWFLAEHLVDIPRAD
jgi:starvation-inducible DNA-binding protein